MPGPDEKSFAIPRPMVWEAWRRVKANKGAPGVDGQDVEEFEADLRNNLYRIWNRMSSGSYLPPPVKAVEIPKPHGPKGPNAGRADGRGQGRADGRGHAFGGTGGP
jgi:RNA-directed DNA polymerase